MMKINKDTENKDFFVPVMVTQTVVAIIIIAAMIFSFAGGGKLSDLMAKGYTELMSEDYGAEDFSEAVSRAAVFSQDMINEFSDKTGIARGGIDIEFSSLEMLEGISFEEIDAGFSMIYPLSDFEITSDFGYRISPVSGSAGIHTGIDMAADFGDDISAAAEGTVLDARWDNSYGNYVKLLHKNNTVSIYAHCSRLCVEEGKTVLAGEKIAEIGSTGASTGNHLHFEVRKDNIRINPYNLLREKESA